MKHTHYLYIGAALLAFQAQAQDLSTEITVERTVVPREREATRPRNVFPELYSPAVQRQSLFPSEYYNPSELTPGIPLLGHVSWPLAAEPSPYRGYASLGYFPALNIGANAGYRLVDTEKSTVGAWLQYSGAKYKATDYQGTKDNYSTHDFTIGIDGRHTFSPRSVLTGALDFSIGSQNRPWAKDDSYSRSATTLNFKAGFASSTGRVAYDLAASLGYFGFNKNYPTATADALHQTDIGIHGSVGLTREDADSRWCGLDVESHILFTNNAPTPSGDATMSATSLRPFLSFENSTGKLRIGLDLSAATGEGDATFRVAPDIFAAWTPASQFMVYANATGGQKLNLARNVYSLSPWVIMQDAVGRTDIPYHLRLGINYGPWTGFNAEIFGQYAKANNAAMPTILLDPQNALSFLGMYDMKGWQVGAALEYKFRQPYSLRVEGTISPDRKWYANLDRALYTLDAKITANPIKPLDISVCYQLRAGRRAYPVIADIITPPSDLTPGDFTDPDANTPTKPYQPPKSGFVNLHNISSLDIAASYRITERLTAFARGENILGHKALDPAGVGLQGIRGLVGVAYKF